MTRKATRLRRWVYLGPLGLAGLAACASGCIMTDVYSKGAKIAFKLVGDAVQESDVDQHAKKLMGQPLAQADAALGTPMEQFEELRTKRQVVVYPVSGDVLSRYGWVIESQQDRIVAVSKVHKENPSGMAVVKKLMLQDKLVGKTAAEIGRDEKYRNPLFILRQRATGNLVRVYDVSKFTDLLGARYCVMRFDSADRCESVRILGVAAPTKQDPA